jgi:uncharacterized protein YbjT (DUF2867 family)
MALVGTVAVTGATGFVGRHVVRELLARGVRVRALVRDGAKAGKILGTPGGLSMVIGDLFRPEGLGELVSGCTAAVHTVGIIREAPDGQTFQRIHVEAVRRLIEAMREHGCERLAHISALGVTDGADTAYARSKFEGETLVRRSGLRWTILRPSMIHGPEGELTRMMADWARGRAAPFLFMPYFSRVKPGSSPLRPAFEAPRIQPVAVEDVARAVAECLDRETAEGEVYPLAGGEVLTWPELLEFVRDRVPLARKGIRPRGIPGFLAAAEARASAMLGMGQLLPFDEGMARMGARDNLASSCKASEHLGFTPAGYREVAAGYLAGM